MLSKINRLKKEKDIEKVFKEGRGYKEDFLILKTVKNNLNKIRFAFVVSNKVSPKATVRNKIKRKLSELIKIKLKAIKLGQDIVIIASPGLEEKDFWEIEEIIIKLFKKAKLVQ